jgi:hypothetical protein
VLSETVSERMLTPEEQIFACILNDRRFWNHREGAVGVSFALHACLLILAIVWPALMLVSDFPVVRPTSVIQFVPPPDEKTEREKKPEVTADSLALPPPPTTIATPQPEPSPADGGLSLSFDDDSSTHEMLRVLETYKARIAFVDIADYQRNRRKPEPDEEPVGLLATQVFTPPSWALEPGSAGVKYQISGYDRVVLQRPEKNAPTAPLMRAYHVSTATHYVMLVFDPGQNGFYWRLESKLLSKLREKGIEVERKNVLDAVSAVRLAWSITDEGARLLEWRIRPDFRAPSAH